MLKKMEVYYLYCGDIEVVLHNLNGDTFLILGETTVETKVIEVLMANGRKVSSRDTKEAEIETWVFD